MDATAILTSLRTIGVEVTADGDRLRFRPRSLVTPGMLDALARHKPEILRLLAADRPQSDLVVVLLGLGATQDYPKLPLKPGVSIAAGQESWEIFAQSAGDKALALAAQAARAAPAPTPVKIADSSGTGCVPNRTSLAPQDLPEAQQTASGATDVPRVRQHTTEARADVHVADIGQSPGGGSPRLDYEGADNRVDELIDTPAETTWSGLTLQALLDALRDHDAQLFVDPAGRLHYAGPKLPPDAPIRAAIAEHHGLLLEIFTFAPGRRCCTDGCFRLAVGGGTPTCSDHRPLMHDTV